MALRIRLQRGGSTHRPHYRMVVAESSARRDGRFVEIIGRYNPVAKKKEDELDLNLERIDYWMGVGAQPSDTARTLIKKYRKAQPAQAEA
jgi:small subunit ribosomal protein S16